MLQEAIDWILYTKIGMEGRLAETLNFFIYDTIKIFLLLFVMITIMGFLRTYISQQRIKRWLSGERKGLGNIMAALFGAVTPFCSCSSIPIFLSFLEAGIPLGITFSFLITSPIINEYLVVLMLGFFGWKITALYVISGLIVGAVSGIVLGRMGLEKYLVKDLIAKKVKLEDEKYENTLSRMKFGMHEAYSIVKKIWIWILVGVGIGAAIHNYIPQEAIVSIINKTGIFTVPIAVALGVPMYGSCAAIVPIAVALFEKGIPLGTALAFMMATSALSLPEAVILRRAMKLQLIGIFFGIVTIAIIATGYLFNILQTII